MKAYEMAIIRSVEDYEREAGHELPASSFYKSLALRFKAKLAKLSAQ